MEPGELTGIAQAINTTNTGVIYDQGDGYLFLISYDICVAIYSIERNYIYRAWDGFSATSAKHIGLFCKYINEKYNNGLSAFNYYDWKESKPNHGFDKKCYHIALLVRRHITYRS